MDSATGDMAAAVEAAFSAATPAASTDSTETTPASATSTPQTESVSAATEPAQDPEKGPIPYERFHEVNERAKKLDEQLKGYGWIKPEHSQELQRFYQRVTGDDPLTAYLDELSTLVQAQPERFAGPLKSWAARTLGQRVANVEPEPSQDVRPKPDLQLEDGRWVYTAAQQDKLDEWRERRFDEKLQPLQQTVNQREADAIFARIDAQSKVDGAKDVEVMKASPGFWEHRVAIAERMKADEPIAKQERRAPISMREAYAQVFIEKVVPQLAAGKAATLQQKVGASSANPSRPSGALAKPPADFLEALEQLAAQGR